MSMVFRCPWKIFLTYLKDSLSQDLYNCDPSFQNPVVLIFFSLTFISLLRQSLMEPKLTSRLPHRWHDTEFGILPSSGNKYVPSLLALSLPLQMAFSYIQVQNENNIRDSVFLLVLVVDSRACTFWESFCSLSCVDSQKEMAICLPLFDVLNCHRPIEIMTPVLELKPLKPLAKITFFLINCLTYFVTEKRLTKILMFIQIVLF